MLKMKTQKSFPNCFLSEPKRIVSYRRTVLTGGPFLPEDRSYHRTVLTTGPFLPPDRSCTSPHTHRVSSVQTEHAARIKCPDKFFLDPIQRRNMAVHSKNNVPETLLVSGLAWLLKTDLTATFPAALLWPGT